MDIMSALDLPERKLHILYNEAHRQRALDIICIARAVGSKDLSSVIGDDLAIHGNYTEGYHEAQLNSLFSDVSAWKNQS